MPVDAIEVKIQDAIKEISAIAERLPGVVLLHDMRDWSIAWMSKMGLYELNISLEELTSLTSEEYYTRFYNNQDSKDYVAKILTLIEENNDNYLYSCFQQTRRSPEHDWKWHIASARIFLRDEEGKPVLVIAMAFPVHDKHHMANKASRLLDENTFLRKNLNKFVSLSKREREVLKMMALGQSSADTAAALFISKLTVETHRKNIKNKLESNSYFELCQYARAFDLI